jgi:voltage-gated potassium channel
VIYRLIRLFQRVYRARGSELFKVLVLTGALICFSTTGFMFFELEVKPDLLWSDALWWSVVTMTTVGYGDFFPTTPAGRFVVGFPTMIFGISILGYLLSTVAAFFIEARSKELKGMTELELEDHILIVHFQSLDRMRNLLNEIRADDTHKKQAVVLIDDTIDELPAELAEAGVKFVSGHPTKEATLNRASFRTAERAIVLARDPNDANSDNHNLAIALTLETLHPDIFSVAECVDPEHIELMYKAGCDSVVCLAELSSALLVGEMLDPGLARVVRSVTSNLTEQTFFLAPIARIESGKYAEVRAHMQAQGFIAVGFKRGSEIALNPDDDARVYKDDLVVVIGDRRPDPVSV